MHCKILPSKVSSVNSVQFVCHCATASSASNSAIFPSPGQLPRHWNLQAEWHMWLLCYLCIKVQQINKHRIECCVRVYVCMCVCVYVRMCVCAYVYVCIGMLPHPVTVTTRTITFWYSRGSLQYWLTFRCHCHWRGSPQIYTLNLHIILARRCIYTLSR